MESYVKGSHGFVKIQPSIHLLSEEGFDFLKDLKAKINDFLEKEIKTIFFIQLEDVSDDLEQWERALRGDILLHELYKKILFYRSFLYLIRKANKQFIYIGSGCCLGSFWEIALCCDQRIWFSTEGKVGFPEIKLEYFPIGGSLEYLAEFSSRTKDQWLEQPILTFSEAKEKGFIDFLGGASFHPEYAIKWVENNPPTTSSKKDVPDTKFEFLDWDKIKELENQWLEIKRITNLSQPWDYAWSLNKSKRF